MAELIILDVGHGNCAVVRDGTDVSVIDCAPGSTLIDTLDFLGIREISRVLISHADEDHIGGATNLLLEKHVHDVYVNPDVRKSDVWHDLRSVLEYLRRAGRTRVHPSLTTNDNGSFDAGELRLEVLAPSPENALGGAGGYNTENRRQSPNSMSAVIRVVHDSFPVALLPADMDYRGFAHLRDRGIDLRARILVFPHHGGLPGGGNAEEFTRELCDVVAPHLIVFSVSRKRPLFPRTEIIRSVRRGDTTPHIACTQLSQNCAPTMPRHDFNHLSTLPARGKVENSCCGGTVVVELSGDGTKPEVFIHRHAEFVRSAVDTPMCVSS